MLHILAQPKEGNNHFKNENNQNCQQIKLYRILRTKELNKKHSSRLVGGVEMGGQGREDQGGSWWTGQAMVV